MNEIAYIQLNGTLQPSDIVVCLRNNVNRITNRLSELILDLNNCNVAFDLRDKDRWILDYSNLITIWDIKQIYVIATRPMETAWGYYLRHKLASYSCKITVVSLLNTIQLQKGNMEFSPIILQLH